MCSDCGTNTPLTLVCKDEDRADGFTVALTHLGGALINSQGEEVLPIRNGDTVTIGWNGDPMTMGQIGGLALVLEFADLDEVCAMADRGTEDVTGIPVAVLRAMREGKSFADAARPVTREPSSDKIDEVIGTMFAIANGAARDIKFVEGDLLN